MMLACWQRELGLRCLRVVVSSAALGGIAFVLPASGSDRGSLQKGLLLMQAEKFEDAAKAWQADAEKLAASESDGDKSGAGVRFVLATIAFEKSEDARAYGTWAKAIEIYLRSGSDWPTERDHLKTEIDESRAALVSVLNGESVNLKTNGSDLSLVNIDAFVGLTKYDGPRRNLKSVEAKKEADIEGGRAYIARPLALQKAPPQQTAPAAGGSGEDDDVGVSSPEPEAKSVGDEVIPRSEDDEIQSLRRAFAPKVKKANPSAEMVPAGALAGKPVEKKKADVANVPPVPRVVPAAPELKGTLDAVEESIGHDDPEMPPHRGVHHK